MLGDLEGIGYSCWPLVVGARHVGAPHRRDRVWIVAHRDGGGCKFERTEESSGLERAPRNVADGQGAGVVLDDSQREGLEGQRPDAGRAQVAEPRDAGVADAEHAAGAEKLLPKCAGRETPVARGSSVWPARPGERQHEWEEPRLLCMADSASRTPRRAGLARERAYSRRLERAMGSSVNGLPVKLVRRWNRNALKAAGNSVVPAVVEQIGRAILRVENEIGWLYE